METINSTNTKWRGDARAKWHMNICGSSVIHKHVIKQQSTNIVMINSNTIKEYMLSNDDQGATTISVI